MKKILSLAFGILLSVSIIGQTVEYKDLSTVNEAKLNGIFHFSFDSSFTLDQLNKASSYYTEQFKAEYSKTTTGYTATITILSSDQLARRVLERYFSVLGVQKINIDGSPLEMRPFLMKFIMLPSK